jgi:hypothetical protein
MRACWLGGRGDGNKVTDCKLGEAPSGGLEIHTLGASPLHGKAELDKTSNADGTTAQDRLARKVIHKNRNVKSGEATNDVWPFALGEDGARTLLEKSVLRENKVAFLEMGGVDLRGVLPGTSGSFGCPALLQRGAEFLRLRNNGTRPSIFRNGL